MGDFLSDSRDDFGTVIPNSREGDGHWVGEGVQFRIPPRLLAAYLPQDAICAPVAIKRNTQLARLMSGYIGAFADSD